MPPRNNNKKILDQVNRSASWFHARKTKPIWARTAGRRQKIRTLEGVEEAEKGDYICQGIEGELWPQSEKSLLAKYHPTGETDPRDPRWRKFAPRRDAQGVMAAQVGQPFMVHSAWGRLSGGAGDYLVKKFEDRDTEYPEDVWIVRRRLFEATYRRVE